MSIETPIHIPELSQRLLEQSVTILPGSLPVLLTVPHDGSFTALESVHLPKIGTKRRDIGVNDLAKDTYNLLASFSEKTPFVLLQNVRREHINEAILSYFDQKAIEVSRWRLRPPTREGCSGVCCHCGC